MGGEDLHHAELPGTSSSALPRSVSKLCCCGAAPPKELENQPEIGISSWRQLISAILLISSEAVSPGSPFWGLHALLHPWGTEELPCLGFPACGSQEFFQKEHHNRGECLSKKSTARETTSSPAFSSEEKLTPSTCQGMPISLPWCSQMDKGQPTMLNQGKEVSSQSWREDLLPQLGDMDGVIC